jgi:hypothetical protein
MGMEDSTHRAGKVDGSYNDTTLDCITNPDGELVSEPIGQIRYNSHQVLRLTTKRSRSSKPQQAGACRRVRNPSDEPIVLRPDSHRAYSLSGAPPTNKCGEIPGLETTRGESVRTLLPEGPTGTRASSVRASIKRPYDSTLEWEEINPADSRRVEFGTQSTHGTRVDASQSEPTLLLDCFPRPMWGLNSFEHLLHQEVDNRADREWAEQVPQTTVGAATTTSDQPQRKTAPLQSSKRAIPVD